MQLFDISYINPTFKFNNLYSKNVKLEEPVKVKDLPKEEFLQSSSYSRVKRTGYNVTQATPILNIIRQSMEELSKYEILRDYEIGYKTKRALLSHLLPETINTIRLKGVISHERKSCWFDIILLNEEDSEEESKEVIKKKSKRKAKVEVESDSDSDSE